MNFRSSSINAATYYQTAPLSDTMLINGKNDPHYATTNHEGRRISHTQYSMERPRVGNCVFASIFTPECEVRAEDFDEEALRSRSLTLVELDILYGDRQMSICKLDDCDEAFPHKSEQDILMHLASDSHVFRCFRPEFNEEVPCNWRMDYLYSKSGEIKEVVMCDEMVKLSELAYHIQAVHLPPPSCSKKFKEGLDQVAERIFRPTLVVNPDSNHRLGGSVF